MRLLKYLYYKFYKLFLNTYGKDDYPQYTAMLAVGLLVFVNFIALYSIIDLFIPLIGFPEISRVDFFLFGGVPYVLALYFIFIYNTRYLQIVNLFKNENEKQRKFGRRMVIGYIIFSLLITILSFVLIVLRNEGNI